MLLYRTGFRIPLFGIFLFFGLLAKILCFLGLGEFGKGPGVDSASFGPSFSLNGPFWVHLGSISDFQFLGNPCGPQIAPLWSHILICVSALGHSDSLGPCRPKADIYGGRRPTLREVGGLKPPHGHLRECGGR